MLTSVSYQTHVVPILAVQVVRAVEANVRVGDDSRIMQIVWACHMRKKPVQENHVSFFSDDRGKLPAVFNVLAVLSFNGRVQAFRMSVEVLDNA